MWSGKGLSLYRVCMYVVVLYECPLSLSFSLRAVGLSLFHTLAASVGGTKALTRLRAEVNNTRHSSLSLSLFECALVRLRLRLRLLPDGRTDGTPRRPFPTHSLTNSRWVNCFLSLSLSLSCLFSLSLSLVEDRASPRVGKACSLARFHLLVPSLACSVHASKPAREKDGRRQKERYLRASTRIHAHDKILAFLLQHQRSGADEGRRGVEKATTTQHHHHHHHTRPRRRR